MALFFSGLKRYAKLWNAPFVLLATCLFSYGLFIPWLSFYLDDWYIMWSYRVLGPGGFFSFFSEDRPFIAILFWLTTPLVGLNPVAWQVFGLLMRWLAVLAFYWAMRQVWPKFSQQVLWTAMLFAVYPGFKQQWISVFYGNAFILMTTFMLSLGCMAAAFQNPKRYGWFTALGLVLSVYTMISWEYYFGLDLVRLAILWVLVSRPDLNWMKRAVSTLRHWLPYGLVWGGYFIWRAFFFRSGRYDIVLASHFRTAPLATLLQLAQTAIQDVFTATWLDWEQVTHAPHAFEFMVQTTYLYWIVVLVSAALAWFFLRWYAQQNQPQTEMPASGQGSSWAWQAIGIGLFSLPFSGIPFWAAGLHVEVDFASDRFTLAMMLGASLLLGGLIDLLVRTQKQKLGVLALALALAIGANFQVSNTFRRESDTLKSFFWQLSWRAPGLKPQTTILTNDLPLIYYSDTSLTSPLNWIYKPDQSGPALTYMLLNAKTRPDSMPNLLKPGEAVDRGIRATTFLGSSSDELALQFTPPGCLHILSADDALLPELPGYMITPAGISNLKVIQPDAQPPRLPAAQFGKEPVHTWCYYFEKMDLAAQQQKWQEGASLAAEARAKGLVPGVASEWLPVINAYAFTGQAQRALEATRSANRMDALIAPRLCAAWAQIGQKGKPASETTAVFQTVNQELDCRVQ